jgi:hypothetical protein
MLRILRLMLLVPVLLSLAACAAIAGVFGYSAPVIQLAAQVDQAKLAADGVSYLKTGKTVTDHIISAATGNDCKVTNILDKAPICIPANSQKSSAFDTN